MGKSNYDDEVLVLAKAVDIAIEAVQKFPPKELTQANLNQFISAYEDFKKTALTAEGKFRNMQSLKSIRASALIYFQESAGEAVNYFWQQITDQNLDIKRENKLDKILKRGKIKNRIEYDFIIDVIVPYQQGGLISETDVIKLNEMISAFEKK